MNNKRFELDFIAKMNVEQVKTATSQMETAFSKIKLPGNLGTTLTKTLEKLKDEIENFDDITSKTFTSMADVNKATKSYDNILSYFEKMKTEMAKIKGLDPEKFLPKTTLDKLKNLNNQLGKISSAAKANQAAIEKETKVYRDQVAVVKELKKEIEAKEALSNSNRDKKGANAKRMGEIETDLAQKRASAAAIETSAKAAGKNFKEDVDYQALQVQIKNLNTEYNRLLRANDKLSESLRTGKLEIDQLRAKQQEAETTAQGLKTNLEELSKVKPEGLQQIRAEIAQLKGVSINQVTTDVTELAQEIQNIPKEKFSEMAQHIMTADVEMEGLEQELTDLTPKMRDFASTAEDMQNMANQVGQLRGQMAQFFSLTNGWNLLRRTIGQAKEAVQEYDAAMTEIAVVSDYDLGEVWGMAGKYAKDAHDLGASTMDVINAQKLYIQQGLDMAEATDISTETIKMARIANIDGAKATELMTAAIRGFNLEMSESGRVNDVFSELAAKTAADTKQIAVALSKTASIANSAGASLENTSAFLAQIIETTQEAPETAGTALKTIIARFQELKKPMSEIGEVDGEMVDANKIESALREAGVALRDTNGEFRNFDDVILELAGKWDGLDVMTQRYIATMAAGSRQQSRFLALMSDSERLTELSGMAMNSAGSSQQQFEKTLESLETATNRLSVQWERFITTLANETIIKTVIDLISGFLKIINDVIEAIGKLGGESEVGGIIKSILAGLVAFGAFKAGGALVNQLFSSMVGPAKLGGQQIGAIIGDEIATRMGAVLDVRLPQEVREAQAKAQAGAGGPGAAPKGSTPSTGGASASAFGGPMMPLATNMNMGTSFGKGVTKGLKQIKTAAKNTWSSVTQLGTQAAAKLKKVFSAKTWVGDSFTTVQQKAKKTLVDVKQLGSATKQAQQADEMYSKAMNGGTINEQLRAEALQKGAIAAQAKDHALQSLGVSEDELNSINKLGLTDEQIAVGLSDEKTKKALLEAAAVDYESDAERENAIAQALSNSAGQVGILTRIGYWAQVLFSTKAVQKDSQGHFTNAAAIWLETAAKNGSTVAQWALNAAIAGCPLGWMALAIMAVVAALGVLIAYFAGAFTEDDNERLKRYQEEAAHAAEAADKANQKFNDLLSAKEGYDDLQTQLDELEKGTDEWNKALAESNAKVLELLNTYPELAQYLGRGEHGQLTIDQAGWDEVIQQQEAAAKRATMDSLYKQMKVNRQEYSVKYNNRRKDTGLSEEEFEALGEAYNKDNTILKDVESLEAALGFEVTEEKLEKFREVIGDLTTSTATLNAEQKRLAETILSTSLSNEQSTYKHSSVITDTMSDFMATSDFSAEINEYKSSISDSDYLGVNDTEFKELAEEYGVEMNTTANSDQDDINIKALYAKMKGISVDEVGDLSKDEMLSSIAEMKMMNDQAKKTQEIHDRMMRVNNSRAEADIAAVMSDKKDMKQRLAAEIQERGVEEVLTEQAHEMGYTSAREYAEALGKSYADMAQQAESEAAATRGRYQKAMARANWVGDDFGTLMNDLAGSADLSSEEITNFAKAIGEIKKEGGDADAFTKQLQQMFSTVEPEKQRVLWELVSQTIWDDKDSIEAFTTSARGLGIEIDDRMIGEIETATQAIREFSLEEVREELEKTMDMLNTLRTGGDFSADDIKTIIKNSKGQVQISDFSLNTDGGGRYIGSLSQDQLAGFINGGTLQDLTTGYKKDSAGLKADITNANSKAENQEWQAGSAKASTDRFNQIAEIIDPLGHHNDDKIDFLADLSAFDTHLNKNQRRNIIRLAMQDGDIAADYGEQYFNSGIESFSNKQIVDIVNRLAVFEQEKIENGDMEISHLNAAEAARDEAAQKEQELAQLFADDSKYAALIDSMTYFQSALGFTADELMSRMEDAYNRSQDESLTEEERKIAQAEYEGYTMALKAQNNELGISNTYVDKYTDALKEGNKALAQRTKEALKLENTLIKQNNALKRFQDNWDDYVDRINRGTTSQDEKVYEEVAADAKDIFGVDNVSTDFVKQNWNLFETMQKGGEAGEEAFRKLRAELKRVAAEESMINNGFDGLLKHYGVDMGNVLNQLSDIEINAQITGTADFSQLFQTLYAAIGDAQTVLTILETVSGYEINLEWEYDSSKAVGLVSDEEAIEFLDGRGYRRDLEGDSEMLERALSDQKSGFQFKRAAGGAGYQFIQGTLKSATSESEKSPNLSRPGDGEDPWESSYDYLHNMVQETNRLIRDRNKLEREYTKLLEKEGSSAQDLYENSQKQLQNLAKQKEYYDEQKAGRENKLQEYINDYADVREYVYIEDGMVKLDQEKLEALSGQDGNNELGERIDEAFDKMTEAVEQIEEVEDSLDEIDDSVNEIKSTGKDNAIELEGRIKDALVQKKQEEIDAQQELSEAISTANSEMLDRLQTNLDEYRSQRDMEEKAEDISDMEGRLALLRSTNADPTEILKLEEELAKSRQDYTDSLIDKSIDEMTKQNEEAQKQREKQIELQQLQLDEDQKNGEIARQANQIFSAMLRGDTESLRDLLKEVDNFAGMTATEQKDWEEIFNGQYTQAGDYWLKNNNLKDLGYQAGQSVSFYGKNGTYTEGTVSSDGQYVISKDRTKKWSITDIYKDSTGAFRTNVQSKAYQQPVQPKPNNSEPETKPITNGSRVRLTNNKYTSHASGYSSVAGTLGVGIGYEDTVQQLSANGKAALLKNIQSWVRLQDLEAFATGGLADFTGPAWLDGTKSRPEYVLNASQTQGFLGLVNILESLKSNKTEAPRGDNYYNIDIHVDELGNDYDVDQLIERIKENIEEDAAYRNVNAVDFGRR